jgi:hypothetical protein
MKILKIILRVKQKINKILLIKTQNLIIRIKDYRKVKFKTKTNLKIMKIKIKIFFSILTKDHKKSQLQ